MLEYLMAYFGMIPYVEHRRRAHESLAEMKKQIDEVTVAFESYRDLYEKRIDPTTRKNARGVVDDKLAELRREYYRQLDKI